MTKLFAVAVLAALCAAPARADDWWFNGGAKGTAGSQSYFGSDWWAQLGDGAWSLKPMYDEFHNDLSTGTYDTFSARLGYDTEHFGVGVLGGGTPKVSGYSNSFGGVDAVVSLLPGGRGPVSRINSSQAAGGGAQGAGLARVDLGASWKYTDNRDAFEAAPGQAGVRGGGIVAHPGNALSIGENDLTGSVGVGLMDALISVDVTKSLYGKDLTADNPRAFQVVRLNGLSQAVQGIPELNVAARVELDMIPIVKPYLSYVKTTYELNQPNSNGVVAGVYTELGILEVAGSYENFEQLGQPDQNFLTLGGTVRF